jgi:hypothetical protein
MLRRLFWLAMGVTIGALVVRKISQAAQKLTPAAMLGGLGSAVRELAESIGEFAGDVRASMREQEAALRAGSGFDGTLGARPEDMDRASELRSGDGNS